MNYYGGVKENFPNGRPDTDMSFETTPLQTSTTVAHCNKVDEQEVSSSLLSMLFSEQCLMIKQVEQYATDNGFMLVHKPKDYFTADNYKEFFPDEIYHEDAKPP